MQLLKLFNDFAFDIYHGPPSPMITGDLKLQTSYMQYGYLSHKVTGPYGLV